MLEPVASGDAPPPSTWTVLERLPSDRALPVALALPAREALLRVLDLPAGDAAELSAMVALQMDKLSPFPTEQMVVGWEALDAATPPRRVLAAAVRRTVAEEAARALEAARRQPAGLDLDLLAWWRLLRDAGALGAEGRELHLRLQDEDAWILVCEDGQPILFRVAAGPFESPADLREELRVALASVDMDRGSAPLARRLFWSRGEPDRDTLATAALDGDPPPDVRPADALPPLSAGTARRALDAVAGRLDLTPPEQNAHRQQRATARRVLTAAVALAVLWIGAVTAAWGAIEWRRTAIARERAHVAELEAPAAEVREVLDRVRAIEDYADRSQSALEAFREVTLRLPEGVTLTSMAYRKGRQVTLRGQAQRPDAIYEYVARMEESPLFVSVQPEGITSRTTPEGPISEFRLGAALPGGVRP